MDVNEQIAITWLTEVKKMFIQSELYFGQYNSDIDILAVSIIDQLLWDCEIKVRTGTTNMCKSSFDNIINNFNCPDRANIIFAVNQNKLALKKKLIISQKYLGETPQTIKRWEAAFTLKNIDVIYFDTVIKELSDFSSSCSKTTNVIIQTLKLSSSTA